MKQDSSTMSTSVYDFNEGDTGPYLARKDIFKNSFNHGRTPYGKQEKRRKSMGSTRRKKCKTAPIRSTKKKSQRTKTSMEAMGNSYSSASDLIEADDSDSELNQDRRKREMRFGGPVGISCLNDCRDEDHVAEQFREVVMRGEQLIFLEQLYSLPEFIFTADGIVLKIHGSGAVGAVKWALHEIETLRSFFDHEKGLAIFDLKLTEHGVRTFLQELGQSDSDCSCHTLSSSISKMESSWIEDMKNITSLSDGYKSKWRAPKEDMSELFHASVKSISRRQDLEDQHLLVDCIAYDRNRASSDNWFDLIFPTKEDQDAVTVTQYDFMLLNPDQFLSDTIIDFYIKYLQSLLSEDENRRFYFYNSFFFRKLTEVDKNFQLGLEKSKSSFERVKRWTAKINIFEKDYLFIPIMQSAHWSLVIVCHPGSLSAGCQDACDSRAPTILHFDSLLGCHTCVEEPIRNYLIEAWNEKNGHSENSESFSTLKFVAVKAPQQTNYSDCGLFLLHYVELFIKEVLKKDSVCFAHEFLQAHDEWFNPAEASSKRAEIQSLIEHLKAKELPEQPEKAWYHTPSHVREPPDGAWSAQRSVSFGDEYLKATILPGNMLDQACSTLVSYPQQYPNNLHVCDHTQLGHHYLESGLELGQLLGARELQQCFCHVQSQAPNGKLSTLCLLQQGAVNHVQDILMPNCTCVEENCAVRDFDLTSLHYSIEGTLCNENLEDLHPLNRGVAINSPEEFAKGVDNDGSTFTKSDSFENNGVNARDLFGFSLHYDDKRVSDMAISTVQKFSLDEVPDVHAFQKGSELHKDHKQDTSIDSLAGHVARSNSEPNVEILNLDAKCGDLEPMVGLTNSAGDVYCLESKETINKCVEGRFLQSEDVSVKMEVDVAIQGDLLTEHKSPHRVSGNSSPSVVVRTGLVDISSDGEPTPTTAEGSREGKRGKGSRIRNTQQSAPATRRVTRSASKRST